MPEKTAVSIVRGANINRTVGEAVSLIGGIDNIVKLGDKVLVKPNFTTAANPQTGLVTDARVLEALINLAMDAGASEVTVGEGSAANDLSEINGLPEVLRRTGAKAVDINRISDSELVAVKIPNPLVLKEIHIPRIALESDVIINVPKLKVAGFVTSLGIKNILGVLKGKGSWSNPQTLSPPFKPAGDKKVLHSYGRSTAEGFRKAVVDLNSVITSHLTVVDGIYGFEGGGEHGGRPVRMNLIIAGKNVVAVDAVASAVMGFDPARIQYIRYAEEKRLGTGRLDRIEIRGLPLTEARRRFEPCNEEHRGLQIPEGF